MKSNKKIAILLSITVLIVVLSTAGITYAFFTTNKEQENTNNFSTSCFGLDKIEGASSKSINLISYPMSDDKGLVLSPYTFTVKNKSGCTSSFDYKVILNVKDTTATAMLGNIKYSLDGSTAKSLENDAQLIELPEGSESLNTVGTYLLDSGTITGTNSKVYNLRLWIDENACNGGNISNNDCLNNIMNQKFEAEVMVYSVPKYN